MLRTIRTRLLLGFLLCIGIPAALAPIVFDYQEDRDALDRTSSALLNAQLELQRTHQISRDFISFGQRDLDFFERGESEYLALRAETLAASRTHLEELRGVADAAFEPIIERIVATLATYETSVDVLTERLRERGFQDFGIVGRMRNAIHSLEEDVVADDLIVHMLSLRRHEKDYIIRNQPQYVERLLERAAIFKEAIGAHTELSAAEQAGLRSRLDDYVAAFEELVAIDQAIGIRNGTGLFGELNGVEQSLIADFDELQSAVNEYALNKRTAVSNFLQISFIIVAALSLIVALFLSRRLTTPLHALSGKMQEYVSSEFKKDADLGHLTSVGDEVGQIARDFGELQNAIKDYVSSIREMAYFDNLTGAASRAYLNQKLNEMINSATRRREGFALFFIDLDAFKDVNDSLGHDAGDELLIEIANRLAEAARQSDFVARLGGDEFCLLLEDISDEADIAVVAERCLNFIERPVTINGKTFRPQSSIGISRFPADGTDAKELMQAGDNAMYAAKVAGHHRFEFFRKEMTQKAADRLTVAQELRAAFQKEQFLLYYQPQVDVRSGQIKAWEALVRWQHPERGMVPPGEFIPEIERLGLINELGNWMIGEVCRQLRQWRDDGHGDMRVSINVAPRQLSDKNLCNTISQAMSSAGVDPSQIEIEVTESGIQSAPDSAEVLEKLKTLGIRVAIDDFGTGYSSLGSLKHLPIDCLKIGRSFVREMSSNSQDAVLLGTIMALGHALKFDIVAEGVEDLEQVQILQGLDCDLVQGYFFSRPIPPTEVPDHAKEGYLEKDAAEASASPTKRAG
ncbi:MAG: EAL domain-containing protein [Woeseiaceae bacterium]|nr:EAL domain-containing protein [Woeseiaceae bacterium]